MNNNNFGNGLIGGCIFGDDFNSVFEKFSKEFPEYVKGYNFKEDFNGYFTFHVEKDSELTINKNVIEIKNKNHTVSIKCDDVDKFIEKISSLKEKNKEDKLLLESMVNNVQSVRGTKPSIVVMGKKQYEVYKFSEYYVCEIDKDTFLGLEVVRTNKDSYFNVI